MPSVLRDLKLSMLCFRVSIAFLSAVFLTEAHVAKTSRRIFFHTSAYICFEIEAGGFIGNRKTSTREMGCLGMMEHKFAPVTAMFQLVLHGLLKRTLVCLLL